MRAKWESEVTAQWGQEARPQIMWSGGEPPEGDSDLKIN